jgi:hypothetical protein
MTLRINLAPERIRVCEATGKEVTYDGMSIIPLHDGRWRAWHGHTDGTYCEDVADTDEEALRLLKVSVKTA